MANNTQQLYTSYWTSSNKALCTIPSWKWS